MTQTTSVSVPTCSHEGLLAAHNRASRRRRLLLTLAVLWVAALGWHCGWIGPAYAQDEETLEMPAETSSETSAPAPAAAPATEETRERSLLDTLIDGGITGLLIGLLSVVSLGFIIEHSMSIRKSTLLPEDVAEELEALIKEGKIEEAITACEDPHNESLLSDVVLAGLRRYRASEFGFAEYKTAVEEAGEDQTGTLYRKTEVLGVIGAIAPMLGLLGTVQGMIESFNQIAATGGTARPDQLAGGIGKALVTTLMGLIVAIPSMIAFSFFRNKIDSIVAEAGKRVEQIMMPLGRRRQ